MQKHGTKIFGDLVFLDQSLFLGRPAGKGDMVDAEYGMPPSKSKGGKDAVKYGAETFATEVKAAKKQQNAQLLKTFVLQASNSLLASDHPFASKASSRIMQWFMRAEKAMSKWGDMAVVHYAEEYTRFYRGRGLPEMYDAEIASSCQGMMNGPGSSGGREQQAGKGRLQQDAGSESVAISEQLAELLKAQAAMVQTVTACTSQLSSLQSEVAKVKNSVKEGGGPGGAFVNLSTRTCHNCGEKGHLAADCPKPKKET